MELIYILWCGIVKVILFLVVFLMTVCFVFGGCQSKHIRFKGVIYSVSKNEIFISALNNEKITDAKVIIPDGFKMEFEPKSGQMVEITAAYEGKEDDLVVFKAVEIKLKEIKKITAKKISPEKVKEMMESEEDFILLDVRTPEEFNEAHIKNAILLPDYEIEKLAFKVLKDKKEKIILYCRSGRRSAIAADKLAGMGYSDVYDMGGIQSWKYDTVKKEEADGKKEENK